MGGFGKWVDEMKQKFIARATSSGILSYDEDRVLSLWTEIANTERGKPETQRIGCAYSLDSWETKTFMRFLAQLKDSWPQVSAPVASKVAVQPKVVINTLPMQCTISVRTDKSLTQDEAKTTFTKHISSSGLKCEVLQVGKTSEDWFDLHISYTQHLSRIYDHLYQLDFVKEQVTKPACDFGKVLVRT